MADLDDRRLSFQLSDDDNVLDTNGTEQLNGNNSDDDESFHYPGPNDDEPDQSYSSRMEELLGDEDDGDGEQLGRRVGYDEEEEEEGFVYTGSDALNTKLDLKGYKSRLRDVLSDDDDDISEDEEEDRDSNPELSSSFHDETEISQVLLNVPDIVDDDEPLPEPSSPNYLSGDFPPSTPRASWYSNEPSDRASSPFLHPTVSRLRSFTPQTSSSRVPSLANSGRTNSGVFDGGAMLSHSPSHLSALSSASSVHSGFVGPATAARLEPHDEQGEEEEERQVFRWTSLRNIGNYVFSQGAQKAASILGKPALGKPTVIAANGMICIGTDQGRVVVYDFKQNLKCVCGTGPVDASTSPGKPEPSLGSVSALALSHDHTFLAAGYTTGHILLFNITSSLAPSSQPLYIPTPVRTVPPLPLTSILIIISGKKEGHLEGSRIVSVGFVAGRHTAIVSADEHGLGFYHSLGKVLFVNAVDIVRVLGRYPDVEGGEGQNGVGGGGGPLPGGTPFSALRNAGSRTKQPKTVPKLIRKQRHRVLCMQPLPLGTVSHPTDTYNLIALLTPTKLVIVGLKPTPRTWFKRPREYGDEEDEKGNHSHKMGKMVGVVVWYPCVNVQAEDSPHDHGATTKAAKDPSGKAQSIPILAYSWGAYFYVLRVRETKMKQEVKNQRTEKTVEVDVGRVDCEEVGRWKAGGGVVVAMQWLNVNQILLVTQTSIEVFDVSTRKTVESTSFDCAWLQPLLQPKPEATKDSSLYHLGHSVRVYKGKIFMLGCDDLRVGTLLTWADRILTFVQSGSFLSAISLALAYYLSTAPGNINALPPSPPARQLVLGQKIRELMIASTKYTFSEDRMHDATHWTSDGRGVDRTELFEGLVRVCAKASIALDDFDFLWEDLWTQYDEAGIGRIYLSELQTFVLDSSISFVPPRITQRLLDVLEEDRRVDLVEKVIWHVDPLCLDLNRAVGVCRREGLYDALVYVYTRGLRDWVGPIVEFVRLIRRVNQWRVSEEYKGKGKARKNGLDADAEMEAVIINAYKVYPYIANVLSGLSYPSEEPLDEAEGAEAKKDVFSFVFFGHSCVWPPGPGGKLVLTSPSSTGDGDDLDDLDEPATEPTYPYTRLLLRFDPESFLHSLDIAFEDSYLNDERRNGRLLVVRILFDILASDDHLPANHRTFIRIFIARNVPKYPQFLLIIPPTQLHSILVGLADPEEDTAAARHTHSSRSTREDRQLAAEYLLSVYTPQNGEELQRVFERAGFWRILRTWHRAEQQFGDLIGTFVSDDEIGKGEAFSGIHEVLSTVTRSAGRKGNKSSSSAASPPLPTELAAAMSDAIPQLLQLSPGDTAILVDLHCPSLHDEALDRLSGNDSKAKEKRYTYLRYLLRSNADQEDGHDDPILTPPASPRLLDRHKQMFVDLQCYVNPREVMGVLRSFAPTPQLASAAGLDWSKAIESCERHSVFDAVVWALDWTGRPTEALDKAEEFDKALTLDMVQGLSSAPASPLGSDDSSVEKKLEMLQAIGKIAVGVCMKHSQPGADALEVPLEDIWYQLLNSQINCVQNVSVCSSPPLSGSQQQALRTLRTLVQTTFGSLVSISSTRAVSFPRLFTRLIEPSSLSSNEGARGSQYSEFRSILTGMLESYRSDEDILHMTKRLIDRDLFDIMEEATLERAKGWMPMGTRCVYCRAPLVEAGGESSGGIVVSRTGVVYHSSCQPVESAS